MHIFRYAIRNILRNTLLSASSVLIIGLLIFFVHILLLVLFSTDRFISSINERIKIQINFQDGYDNTQSRSQELITGITTGFSGVVVSYISREQAKDIILSRNQDFASLFENKTENPFPNSIRLSGIGIDLYAPLNVYIARFRDILQYDQTSLDKKLLDYRTQYEHIASIIEKLHTMQIAVFILLGLFVFTVAIVIYMVIHNFVFFLQDEIRIIELVGGRSLFIYGPLVLQGIIYAGIAGILATLVFMTCMEVIHSQQLSLDLASFVMDFSDIFTQYIGYILLGFTVLGGISAFLSSWQYVHSTIGE
jgi:cell division transport system permease protein